MFNHFRRRIDAYNPSVLDSWTDSRDGEIKLLGAWIPYRLFGAVGRGHAVGQVKGDSIRPGACRLGEYASLRVEVDERTERRLVGVVDRQDQRILWVDRQLVRTVGRAGVGLDAIDKRQSRLVERNHTTGGVSYKKAVCRGHDALGTGRIVAAREPGESPCM